MLPPNIPAPLGRALGHGLDSDPAQRTQTIQQWHSEVDQALSTLADAASSSPSAGPALPPPAPRIPTAAAAVPARSNRRVAVIAAGAIVALGVVGLVAASMRDSPNETANSTVVSEPPTDLVTTTPSTDLVTTTPTFVDPALPTAVIIGPDHLEIGEEGFWTVTATNATSGTWSVVPYMVLTDASWTPDVSNFQGTWNQGGTIELTLTVFDEAGHSAVARKVFTVG